MATEEAAVEQTKELIKVIGEQMPVAAETGEMLPYKGASMIPISREQGDSLVKPFQIHEYDIKPTGEVYVGQVHYRRRLNQVFGPGQWALVPMSEPKTKRGQYDTQLFQKFHLLIQGSFVSEAWGEGAYNHGNANASEATALEGVKSNALMRCCKDLGIASECWDRAWTEKFKTEHCVKVKATNRRGELKDAWRLKTAKPFEGEKS